MYPSSVCSCLENPRDAEASWAAVYGVAQSWTRLKRLSSSSVCVLKEWAVMQPLGTMFCYLVEGWPYSWSSISPSGYSCRETSTCAVGALCSSWKAHSWTINDSEKLETASVHQQENGCKITGRLFLLLGFRWLVTLCKLKVYDVLTWGFPEGAVVKTRTCTAWGRSSIPGWGTEMSHKLHSAAKKRKYWPDPFICFSMIAVEVLAYTSITLCNYIFLFVVRIIKSPSRFDVYNTVLYIITILPIRSPGLVHILVGNLYP